jgi:two-component system sensor histidine kinase FlrB
MAAGIAHEIRNPLGSIQLYAQALGEEVGDSVVASSLCDKIARGVRHLDAVVRDVLSFAREMKLQSTQVDAIAVVHRALESCNALLSSHEIQVNISSTRQHQLEGDETLLIQALSNLIRNSVEAMSEANAPRKAITLDVRRAMRRCPDHVARERVIFVVEDSGPGIPADVVDRMFNPFFTTRRTGTGLGLAIVHRIVDAHGGQICVGSAEDGTGARIEVCLPPAQRPRPASSSTVDHDTVDDEKTEIGSSLGRSERQGPEQCQHIGDGIRLLARESHA